MKKLLVIALLLGAMSSYAAVSVSLSANNWMTQSPRQLYVTMNADAGESVTALSFEIAVDKPGPSGSEYFTITGTDFVPFIPGFLIQGPFLMPTAGDPNGDVIKGSGGTNPADVSVIASPGVTGVQHVITLDVGYAPDTLFDYYTFTLEEVSWVIDGQPTAGEESNPATVLIPEPGAAALILLAMPLGFLRRRRRR